MAKETKVGLLIGLALILLVGIILSDLVSGPAPVTTVQEQAAGFGPQAQHDIYAPDPTAPDRIEAGHTRSFERPTVLHNGADAAVPDAFRTQPAFGQGPAPTGSAAAPGQPLLLTGPGIESDRAQVPPPSPQFAPPPSRRPDLPEPDTREAAGRGVAELPQAWRVDRDATATLTAAPPTPAADPAVSATPEDGSFFIPPPQPAVPQADRGSDRFHLVGPRDSLAAVARKHYGDPAYATGIAQANPGLVGFGGTLRPGDRIALPALDSPYFTASATPTAPATASAPQPLPPAPPQRATAAAPAGTVTVAAGDTLSGLAARHLGSGQRWDALLAANPDVLERPEALREGMVLRLPGATATAAAAAPATPASATTYTVKAGDNLTHIAARTLGNGQRWDEIFAANRDQLDNPEAIREGMVLVLPAGSPAAAAAPTPAAPSPPAAAKTYTVKAGDNLTRIAAHTLGDGQRWDDLFAANRDVLDAPESLRVGQVLRLP